jgi:hypothetical protein
VRNSTHVSYLLTAASVNAGRLKRRAAGAKPAGESGIAAAAIHSQESGLNLGGLFSAFVLFFTVVVVVAIGILAAYAAIIGILHALAPRSSWRKSESPVVTAGRTHAAHAGGD